MFAGGIEIDVYIYRIILEISSVKVLRKFKSIFIIPN